MDDRRCPRTVGIEMTIWHRFNSKLREWFSSEAGASLVEYALLVALLALVALVAIRFFGSELSTTYNDIAQSMP